MDITKARRIAALLGFNRFLDLRGGRSLAEAVKLPESGIDSLIGVYMLFRNSDRLYVGKTRNLLSRYQQHVSEGHECEFIGWRSTPAQNLDEQETAVIRLARENGLALLNRAKMPTSAICRNPDASFDDIVLPDTQDQFLEDLATNALSPEERLVKRLRSATPNESASWELFTEQPAFPEMWRAALSWFRHAIPPEPELNPFYWSVCIIKTNRKNARLPLLWIQTGTTTPFELYAFSQTPDVVFCTLSLSAACIHEHQASRERLLKRFPWVALEAEPWVEITADELNAFRPSKKAFMSPAAREQEMKRDVARALMRPPVKLSFPLSGFNAVFEDRLVKRAAALYAIASMRMSPVARPELCNTVAAQALIEGIDPAALPREAMRGTGKSSATPAF